MCPLPGKLPKSATSSSAERIVVGSIVEYDQHGKPILGIVTGNRKDQWLIVNEAGQELAIAGTRLHLLPAKANLPNFTKQSCADYLAKIKSEAIELAKEIDLEQLWQVVSSKTVEISVSELSEIYSNNNDLLPHMAMRRALVADKIFFKRKKVGYEPRPAAVIEELKVQARVEAEKQQKREKLKQSILRAVAGEAGADETVQFPPEIDLITHLAVFGSKMEQAKEATNLLTEILEITGFDFPGRADDKAFSLLVKIGVFKSHENLQMHRYQRSVDFEPEVNNAAKELIAAFQPLLSDTTRVDLTALHTITIDADSTKDIDDALSVEKLDNGYRVGVHITDVATAIKPDSILQSESVARGTSIYFAEEQVPMLPVELSQDVLSLVKGQKRLALSFLLECDNAFNITSRSIVRSVIRVRDRLNYDQVDELLFNDRQNDLATPELIELLSNLWQATCVLEENRIIKGACQFNRREMQAQLAPDGKVYLVPQLDDTPSHKLVGEMMILANETAALFAKHHHFPIVFRSQEPPEQEPSEIEHRVKDIPEGSAKEYARLSFMKRSLTSSDPLPHYSLGLDAYTQVTSPIRRAVDLLNQQQIVSFIQNGKPLYSNNSLLDTLNLISAALDDSIFIQRNRNKY